MGLSDQYDLIVVGAGHAGCEAAYAASKLGHSVLLLTLDTEHVALMSCNPSIGGLAKGHLVREIDALGGIQALATDATGIQYRMLNTRKGPAVQAPRAQCDKLDYNRWMREFIRTRPHITLASGMASDLILEPGGNDNRMRVKGVMVRDWQGSSSHAGTCHESPVGGPGPADAVPVYGRAVVCTTGTFLDGLIHIGMENFQAGRMGENAAVGLGDAFDRAGFETGRLKTGTPPRLRAGSIDFDRFEKQPGDTPIPGFSFMTGPVERDQVCCWITYTNDRTHELIREGLDRSPMYTGVIEGVGPRYCPSIEDKIVRFSDKPRHQIFLEPEGLTTDWIYPNGLSTSLPRDVQESMLRSIEGLEDCEIIRPGYAVEYTYCPPHQLWPGLMTKHVDGLFFGGQINGTSGYEEAAAQGLMAGLNAALWLKEEDPLVLGRDEAYIGVLIDDLITMDHREPYRMFTSRAEYRLLLRHDSADLRLTPHAHQHGLIDDERWTAFQDYRKTVEAEINRIESATLNPSREDREHFSGIDLPWPKEAQPLTSYLARPEVSMDQAVSAGLVRVGEANLPEHELVRAANQVVLQVKYDGYIRKQREQVQRMQRMSDRPLPDTLDYLDVYGLRNEAREKLMKFRPATIAHAGRIAGVNQADLSLILVHLKTRSVA
jgi:tRNA uridine 5-carboxymethylaminomethyl modification enzyme